MDANDIDTRFQHALAGATPADALYALANSLKTEGMSQTEMYDLFNRHREQHRNATDEKLHDAITDTMDRIVGWTAPNARLFDKPLTPACQHLYATFVVPFYRNILHGNWVHLRLPGEDHEMKQNFIRRAKATLEIIDSKVVDLLFNDNNWRTRMVASWFCGLKGWRQYSDVMGDLLVPSRQCYAGQAHCFALACFADEKSAGHLCRYLDEYLRQPDKEYDQYWAMPALLWIDRVRGTSYSTPYTEAGGLWHQYLSRLRYPGRTLSDCQSRFVRIMEATITTFGIGLIHSS
jgi:hypothetical protein